MIFITASNRKEADRIGRMLLEGHLVACINIIDPVASMFWWQGRIDKAREVLLVAKSKRTKFAAIVKAVKAIHSYEVPEIIAMPVIVGEKRYLEWINGSIRNSA